MNAELVRVDEEGQESYVTSTHARIEDAESRLRFGLGVPVDLGTVTLEELPVIAQGVVIDERGAPVPEAIAIVGRGS